MIVALVIGLVVVLGAGLGVAFWWLQLQPIYRPGSLAKHSALDPVGVTAEGGWEVAPGMVLKNFSTGEGRNVLVVHGGPGIPPSASAAAFDALADSYRFHYYDQRGTGGSTRPDLNFSGRTWPNIQELDRSLGITEQLADIERIRRLLGDEQLIVVGHSYGAFLAALYAAEMPGNVERLILVAPADLIVFPSRWGGLFDNLRDRLSSDQVEAFEEWQERYLDLSGVFDMTEPELIELDSALGPFFEAAAGPAPAAVAPPPEAIGAWHARAQFFAMGKRHDYSPALDAITAPTLIVHGGNDLQPVDVANDYDSWIPDTRVVTIDGSSHFPHYTHPEDLSPIVRDFLDQSRPEAEAHDRDT